MVLAGIYQNYQDKKHVIYQVKKQAFIKFQNVYINTVKNYNNLNTI